MPRYSPESTVGSARAQLLSAIRFPADGGYGEKSVKLRAGCLTLAFPNTATRVRAVKLHDVHHVLTECDTTWRGEAEIGAWEIASGCERRYPAWFLNLGAMTIGLAIAPRRTFRAFVRGRHSGNLYHTEFTEDLLERGVGELRTALVIPLGPVAPAASDVAGFAAWSLLLAAIAILPFLALAAGVRYVTH